MRIWRPCHGCIMENSLFADFMSSAWSREVHWKTKRIFRYYDLRCSHHAMCIDGFGLLLPSHPREERLANDKGSNEQNHTSTYADASPVKSRCIFMGEISTIPRTKNVFFGGYFEIGKPLYCTISATQFVVFICEIQTVFGGNKVRRTTSTAQCIALYVR